MKKRTISYELHEAGWASLQINDGIKARTYAVSYLHDSLLELATAAVALLEGAGTATAIFMDEPGELELQLVAIGPGKLEVSGKWYADWTSWGMHAANNYELAFSFELSLLDFAQDVFYNLEMSYITHGVEDYKEKWVEHEFPLHTLKKRIDGYTG